VGGLPHARPPSAASRSGTTPTRPATAPRSPGGRGRCPSCAAGSVRRPCRRRPRSRPYPGGVTPTSPSAGTGPRCRGTTSPRAPAPASGATTTRPSAHRGDGGRVVWPTCWSCSSAARRCSTFPPGTSSSRTASSPIGSSCRTGSGRAWPARDSRRGTTGRASGRPTGVRGTTRAAHRGSVGAAGRGDRAVILAMDQSRAHDGKAARDPGSWESVPRRPGRSRP